MPEQRGDSFVDAASVDAAIARVLQAEHDARDDVQRCAAEAESLVESAKELARQIARRAAHRSVRVQRWSAATLQQQFDELAAQQSRMERLSSQTGTPRSLQAAVDALATHLTGEAR